jgi:hypothetical protein
MGLFDDFMSNSVFCCSHARANTKPKSSLTYGTKEADSPDKSADGSFPALPRKVPYQAVSSVGGRDTTVCGVGIVFQDHEEGLVVSSMVVDGPAYRANVIQQGDLLHKIDGTDVRRSNAADLGTRP